MQDEDSIVVGQEYRGLGDVYRKQRQKDSVSGTKGIQREYKGITKGIQRDVKGITKETQREYKANTKGIQRDVMTMMVMMV